MPGVADGPLHPFDLATSTFVIIFSGEKPYPCRFCGRRFRTNYNKLGHEKKCPDSHGRNLMPLPPNSAPGPTLNPADSPQTTGPATSTTPVGSAIGSSDFHWVYLFFLFLNTHLHFEWLWIGDMFFSFTIIPFPALQLLISYAQNIVWLLSILIFLIHVLPLINAFWINLIC